MFSANEKMITASQKVISTIGKQSWPLEMWYLLLKKWSEKCILATVKKLSWPLIKSDICTRKSDICAGRKISATAKGISATKKWSWPLRYQHYKCVCILTRKVCILTLVPTLRRWSSIHPQYCWSTRRVCYDILGHLEHVARNKQTLFDVTSLCDMRHSCCAMPK